MSAGEPVEPPKEAVEPKKGEARRLQIVQAAIRCFEAAGFHGTSMAQISEAAGMSVGHIYHYFPGKEALIAAIVEVKLNETFERMNRAASRASLFDVLIARAGDCVENESKPGERALFFEIVAEGERNPKVADLLRRADARLLQRQREVFRDLEPEVAGLGDGELNARLEVFNALLSGLMLRTVVNPSGCENDPQLEATIERVLHSLIGL